MKALVECTRCNYQAFRLEFETLGYKCSKCGGLVKIIGREEEVQG